MSKRTYWPELPQSDAEIRRKLDADVYGGNAALTLLYFATHPGERVTFNDIRDAVHGEDATTAEVSGPLGWLMKGEGRPMEIWHRDVTTTRLFEYRMSPRQSLRVLRALRP